MAHTRKAVKIQKLTYNDDFVLVFGVNPSKTLTVIQRESIIQVKPRDLTLTIRLMPPNKKAPLYLMRLSFYDILN